MAESNKVNLLICTQKVDINDPILGFFHDWIEEFSQYCYKLTVICLEKGEFSLPDNVRVVSLGKENGIFKIKYILNFYKYIWKYHKDYNSVFVHMNPEYVCLGGLFWKFWRKKITLWYMHKSVNFKLWLAEKFVCVVFSATKESFRLKTDKLKITGHGINLSKFSYSYSDINKKEIKFINIGRLSPIKRVEDLIEFAYRLKNKNINFNFKIIGQFSSLNYQNKIENLVQKYNLEKQIEFVGQIPNSEVNKYLQESNIFIHSGETTSLDKSILEAMFTGTFVFTNVESSINILRDNDLNIFTYNDIDELIHNLNEFISFNKIEQKDISLKLRDMVLKNHDLKRLINKIVKLIR